jgi:hypothetical protein
LILNFIKKNQVDQILNLSREFPFNFKKTQWEIFLYTNMVSIVFIIILISK